MTSIINASPSNGITQTADGSGVMSVYWLRCAEHTDINLTKVIHGQRS